MELPFVTQEGFDIFPETILFFTTGGRMTLDAVHLKEEAEGDATN